MRNAKVAVLKTQPDTVIEDYKRSMRLAGYSEAVSKDRDTLLKLNLSWTKYFPACSSQPWQLEGVLATLLEDGFSRERLAAIENRTVVTNPRQGAVNNKWLPVLKRYGVEFVPLTEVEWVKYEFKGELLKLNNLFPEGIEIPRMLINKNVIHLPTVKTHGHSVTTGAIKNAFGGLLKEVRHYAHKYIHEVLVDLMVMQKELHPGIFAAMDGTVCGDGAGPRTMVPKEKNIILASADSVAIDAVAAKVMGFDPIEVPYIRMCHERGLGIGRIAEIEIVGEDIQAINFGFKTGKSLVIWGDQLLRRGPLRFLEKPLLHSPLFIWAPIASTIFHDWLWYPTIGRTRIRRFLRTKWGRAFSKY